MTRMSVSCSSKCVAKLWRSVCGDTRFLMPAASAAAWTARLSWRVESGSSGLRPGNSHPRGSNTPRCRPSRHQARNSSSSCGDSMAWRSLRPLPCSTRSSMRSESTSPTLSATTSETRSPAPYAVANAALYFGPGEQGDLLDAQHGRQPARFAHDREPPCKVRPVERHGQEETQGCDCTIDARRPHAGLCLMQLKATQILCGRRVGRPTEKGGQCADVTNVVVARLLAEATHVHVFDHARPQCANRPVGRRRAHWGSSRELKVAGPSMLATGCPDRHALPLTPPKTHRPYHALLPRERVRSWVASRPPNRVPSV